MPRLQIVVSEELDKKLSMYSAYLGLSKNAYAKQMIINNLRKAEQEVIPKEIVKIAEEKGEVRDK